jgi:ribonuclease HI
MIYTDGSSYRNGVGAVAVLYVNGNETDSLKFQLGMAHEHTVFEAELVGIILGTHLATKHPTLQSSINYSIDNQATMKLM